MSIPFFFYSNRKPIFLVTTRLLWEKTTSLAFFATLCGPIALGYNEKCSVHQLRSGFNGRSCVFISYLHLAMIFKIWPSL